MTYEEAISLISDKVVTPCGEAWLASVHKANFKMCNLKDWASVTYFPIVDNKVVYTKGAKDLTYARSINLDEIIIKA
jgi:hypothetical protein